MNHLLKGFISLIIVFSINPLQAQDKWNMEFRTGSAFATQDLGDADLSSGFGFELVLAYRLMPHLAVYGGWGWNQFSAEKSFLGSNLNFEETGYTFGLQFIHPITDSKINYLLRTGAVYNHIETENNKGDIINDSGHGLGWQAETGLVIPIGKSMHLLPSVRYRSLARDIDFANSRKAVDLNYFSIGVGLSWVL